MLSSTVFLNTFYSVSYTHLFNLGILAGFAVVMSVCTAFSSALYSFLPRIEIIMKILGAAYMLYLAWKVWKSAADLKPEGGKEAGFLAGMILQFANPKIYILSLIHI